MIPTRTTRSRSRRSQPPPPRRRFGGQGEEGLGRARQGGAGGGRAAALDRKDAALADLADLVAVPQQRRAAPRQADDPLQVEVVWSRLQIPCVEGHEALAILCDENDSVADFKQKIYLRQQMLFAAGTTVLQPDRMLLFLRSVRSYAIARARVIRPPRRGSHLSVSRARSRRSPGRR